MDYEELAGKKEAAGQITRSESERKACVELGIFRVSRFASTYDARPSGVLVELDALVRALTVFRPTVADDKTGLPAWSPAWYPPDTEARGKTRVDSVSCLVLDFDDGTTCSHAMEFAATQRRAVIGHTSWSHGIDGDRFRLVFPLARPVPGEQWTRAWQWALSWWDEHKPPGAGCPDRSCSDASRIFYVPAYRVAQKRFAWSIEGALLDVPWHDVMPEPPRPKVPKYRPPLRNQDVGREVRERFKTDAGARRRLAAAIGATVTDTGTARRIDCPQCGRPDVWFDIQPDARHYAKCNHRNTCGWFGSLWDLATAKGLHL